MVNHTATTQEAVLIVDGLRRTFGDLVAVEDLSLAIAPGETYGLLGPNGAGKTTAISMICGLLTPDRGTSTVAGHPVGPTSKAAKAAVGYVPQDLALYPDLTARENLTFFGRLQGMPRDELRTRVDEALDVIGLSDRAGDRTEEFSGGMKRRLNIGIGMLHRPQLLVLDEPTVGVDSQSRNAILDAIEALGGSGTAVLYTTHYMEEAERLCDRVGIIDHGVLVAEGTRRELTALVGQHDRVELDVDGDAGVASSAAGTIDGVVETSATDHSVIALVDDARLTLPRVLATLAELGTSVRGVQVHEPDLEAVFLHLTGRALRD